ncbi:hypothetical protein CK203_106561 [Vitis vinifera]|uniref:Uncharacterized protein n=1 Tax=Vitis vinifera TaxID=29760 RepID=A0A438DVD1_VITVI|nr:hypothetical protein CK203_106561 [Vitis vinifera]
MLPRRAQKQQWEHLLQFYTDDAPGLEITLMVVLVMSLCSIDFVTTLHVFGEIYRHRIWWSGLIKDSESLCKYLLDKAQVALVPGSIRGWQMHPHLLHCIYVGFAGSLLVSMNLL